MGELRYVACLAYIKCLVPVIGDSGYSDDIAISSWTLSRYRDPQKVHYSSPSIELQDLGLANTLLLVGVRVCVFDAFGFCCHCFY